MQQCVGCAGQIDRENLKQDNYSIIGRNYDRLNNKQKNFLLTLNDHRVRNDQGDRESGVAYYSMVSWSALPGHVQNHVRANIHWLEAFTKFMRQDGE